MEEWGGGRGMGVEGRNGQRVQGGMGGGRWREEQGGEGSCLGPVLHSSYTSGTRSKSGSGAISR